MSWTPRTPVAMVLRTAFLHEEADYREGEDRHMKPVWKCASRVATAILAVSFAVALAPAWGADDPPSSQPAAQPASSPATSTDTQQRLAELEKEVSLLEQEIAALKDSNTPGLRTAAYVSPGGAPSSAPDGPPPVTLGSLLGSTTFSGFVDGYYGFNADHPYSNMSGLRAFDQATNAFSLNNTELIVDHPPDAMSNEGRLGFHVALGYGQAALAVNNSDPFSDGSNFYVKEAYGSYLAPIGKGLKIDVGRFVTPFGAEVIETNANWNYSRSILFYYAIPYMHFGARAAYTVNKQWALTGYLVNGWNNTVISHQFGGVGSSAALTYGGTVAWTPNAKWAVTENYMAGPVIDLYTVNAKENPYTISHWKQLADTVIAYTPNMKWAFQVNGDYGFGPRYFVCPDACTFAPAVQWWGAAAYAKYNFNAKSNFAVRYEYYGDPNGYTLFGSGFSKDSPHAQEFTGTYSYNLTSGLLVRAEYRYDFAREPIFERGSGQFVKEQDTATLGIVYSFNSPSK